MKNSAIKSIWIILPIVLFFLSSYASSQQNQIESRDAEFYNNRGMAFRDKSQYDGAISDYSKALEINPRFAEAYNNRGRAYYLKGKYDKSLEDIKKAQDLGYNIPPKFIEDLRKISEKQKK